MNSNTSLQINKYVEIRGNYIEIIYNKNKEDKSLG